MIDFYCTKMGGDCLSKNTPNAKFVCPSPKVLDFNVNRLHWASVVRATKDKPNPTHCTLFVNINLAFSSCIHVYILTFPAYF